MIAITIVISICVTIILCFAICAYETYKEKELEYNEKDYKRQMELAEMANRLEMEKERTKQKEIDYQKEQLRYAK